MQSKSSRKLADGAGYDVLISPAAKRDRLISKEAGVPDTLRLVARVATEYRGEVAKLADKLRVNTAAGAVDVKATCRALWEFVYNHIQYHLDEPGLEQVRHPARSWADRVRGVDCEDYSVFLSALLQNMAVPHVLRISAYKGGWQHIYVIVPTAPAHAALPKNAFNEDYKKASPDAPRLRRQDYITLDCVTDQFDYEVAPSKTMNLAMPQLLQLSGFDDTDEIGTLAGVYDTQIVATYPSESGHTVGVGDLGSLFVRDNGDFEEISGLGAIGGFKPWKSLKKGVVKTSQLAAKGLMATHQAPFSLVKTGQPFSTKIKKGALIKKMVGEGGSYRNPADIPGATDIAAAYLSDSQHYIGVDHLGGLYVMGHNEQFEQMAGLAGLDPNDPLAGVFKKAFKKVGKVAKVVAKPVAKASKFAAKNVQKGLDVANKIPGVKYLADNYGMTALQVGGGLALTAFTGGGAAPLLLAAKAAKGVSVAKKVATVAKVAKVTKAAQAVSKARKVVVAAKKVQAVVQVAQQATKLMPRKAVVPPAAIALEENENPISFIPASPDQIQDFAPQPLNLVQRVDEPAAAAAPAPNGPTIALTPETAAYADEDAVITASVLDPGADAGQATPYADEQTAYADKRLTYATEEPTETVSYDEEIQGFMPNRALMMQRDNPNQLGALGLNNTTVIVAGGAVLALGLGLLLLSGQKRVIRAASGLSGAPKRRRRPAAKSPSKRRKGGARTLNL